MSPIKRIGQRLSQSFWLDTASALPQWHTRRRSKVAFLPLELLSFLMTLTTNQERWVSHFGEATSSIGSLKVQVFPPAPAPTHDCHRSLSLSQWRSHLGLRRQCPTFLLCRFQLHGSCLNHSHNQNRDRAEIDFSISDIEPDQWEKSPKMIFHGSTFRASQIGNMYPWHLLPDQMIAKSLFIPNHTPCVGKLQKCS